MSDKQQGADRIDEQPEAAQNARREREAIAPEKPSQAEGERTTTEESVGNQQPDRRRLRES